MFIYIVLWLFVTFIGCLILYWIIRSAIDNSSVLSNISKELSTMGSRNERELQFMRKQVIELTYLIKEQNESIRTMKREDGEPLQK